MFSHVTPFPFRCPSFGVFGCTAALSFALLLSACGQRETPESAEPSAIEAFLAHDYSSGITPAARPQNFLFIILDAFHAGHSSMLGYDSIENAEIKP